MPERTDLVRLRQEIVRDLAAAQRLLEEVAEHGATLSTPGADRVLLGYVAVTLHQHYTAIETVFERIAQTMEESLPKGADAHQALLRDMTLELPRIRPAAIQENTANMLRPLLRFRHFVRHSYGVTWDGERLAGVLEAARRAWPEVHRDLSGFVNFLERAIGALE